MANRPLTLTDGQLSASSATLIDGASVPGGRCDLLLTNTEASEQTITLTLTLSSGSTARQLPTIVLKENESAILRSIPMQGGDTLAGYATSAESVDYIALACFGGANCTLEIYDERGAAKGVAALHKILVGIESIVGAELPDLGG